MAFTSAPPSAPVHTALPGKKAKPPSPPSKRPYRFTPVSGIIAAALLGGAALLSILGNHSTPAPAPTAPSLAVTSQYHVGSVLAGAAGTTLHISGAGFAANSPVTLLLDGALAPDTLRIQSDPTGQAQTDLTLTANWPIGRHTLSARDGQGHTVATGVSLVVVAQGEAMTPGPNGAPYDSQTFSFTATVSPADAVTGAPLPGFAHTLAVTGRPDPAGGAVCDLQHDTNQPITQTGVSGGVAYTQTYLATCSGTYKGGKLSYIETLTSYQITFANGVACRANVPVVHQSLTGSFTDAKTIIGVYSADAMTITCSNGTSIQDNPQKGTWTGVLNS
jgi:hypothetical protein